MSGIAIDNQGIGKRAAPALARGLALGLAMTLLASGASAQMYTWKDAKGVTHFSDQPPPDQVAGKTGVLAARTLPRTSASQPSLPYALSEAAKRSPVTLYTTASCESCDQGRALLQQRGVPFSEKTVNSNDDQKQLKAAGSDSRLPMLVVGANKHIGFEAVAWNEALTAANYPLQSRLPAGWRQPAAVPAAPVAAAPAEPEQPAAREPTPQKPPPKDAPPGFQF